MSFIPRHLAQLQALAEDYERKIQLLTDMFTGLGIVFEEKATPIKDVSPDNPYIQQVEEYNVQLKYLSGTLHRMLETFAVSFMMEAPQTPISQEQAETWLIEKQIYTPAAESSNANPL